MLEIDAGSAVFSEKFKVVADFGQIEWDELCREDAREIIRLAIREDLEQQYDWTTLALVPHDAVGRALLVTRESGVIAGLPVVELLLEEMNAALSWRPERKDGELVQPGQRVAVLEGPARGLLTTERILLNLLGRMCGVATQTRRYVDAVAGTEARIFDTRKTTPGWRRLEKYAVRQGGGCNHRLNLCQAVLIKDNHLALGAAASEKCFSPAEAVERARDFLAGLEPQFQREEWIVEIEVDTLQQLEEVLPAQPDIVLLDNMSLDQLRQAVTQRNQRAPQVVLEASGGVTLESIADIARTGVDRISVGALTHAAAWLDLGLDWQ